jgi:hypothetical protein
MDSRECYASYLVRIWNNRQVGGEGEPFAWQGELVNIQDGFKIRFDRLEELLQYLQVSGKKDRPGCAGPG